jgi:putative ABC transport system permease protein
VIEEKSMQLFRQFRSRPLQSALTVIAVALGVAVVTAVAAFLDISRQTQTTLINSLWAREITLQTTDDDYTAFSEDGQDVVREVGLVADETITLAIEDMEKARAAAPSVDYAYVTSPVGLDTSAIYENGFEMLAVSQDYLAVHDITVLEGSSFSESDYKEQRNVALVTTKFLDMIGMADKPVGQALTAADFDGQNSINIGFDIIGIIAADEEIPEVLIPFRPDAYNPANPPTFVVNDVNSVDEARAELEAFATKTWGGRVTVRSENIEGYRAQQRSSGLLIAVLASVGLMSAALNIMNLLLARVFKSRRDTGILRSLGATRTTIRNQYLADALLLGAIGGVFGVALGYGLLFAFNLYVATASSTPITTSPSLLALLVGLLSAVGMSAVFALYPALLASRLNVVDALKEL